MSDYGLFLGDDGLIDMAFTTGDVAKDDTLQTAILISLFTDARATPELIDPLDQDSDLRGFWGDTTSSDSTGSLLWTMKREKQLVSVLAKARQYVVSALQWMIEDKVAERVEVETSYPQRGWMLIVVQIYRPGSRSPVSYRFNYQWQSQILQAVS